LITQVKEVVPKTDADGKRNLAEDSIFFTADGEERMIEYKFELDKVPDGETRKEIVVCVSTNDKHEWSACR
jgi:hypothetical protein